MFPLLWLFAGFAIALMVAGIVIPHIFARREYGDSLTLLAEDAGGETEGRTRLSPRQRIGVWLRGVALRILNRLFPPERPSDAELIAIGRQQEREQAHTRVQEAEARYAHLVEDTPTARYPAPVVLPVMYTEPEQHTDSLQRLQSAWWYEGKRHNEPETEKTLSVNDDTWWKH